jgi:hypothetical protein
MRDEERSTEQQSKTARCQRMLFVCDTPRHGFMRTESIHFSATSGTKIKKRRRVVAQSLIPQHAVGTSTNEAHVITNEPR